MSAVAVDVPEPDITVRRYVLDADAALPRWWFYDSALITHLANGINLLFPKGERFFIRSVRHFADRVDDPGLRARIRAFAGQEAQHGRAHEAVEGLLRAQGFELDSFLDWYDTVAFRWLEPAVPAVLRLSVTAALEHFTATLATDALTDGFLDAAPADLRDLLRWHACEEIEHKSVAFDVLQAVDDRYVVRIVGLVVGGVLLVFFWRRATGHLLAQEPGVDRDQLRRERAEANARGQRRRFLREAVLSYLTPGFHPDQVDNRPLAAAWLAAHAHRFGRVEAAHGR
ncbi:MAG: metal-dependent hydrolase [Alphaproteobacteria bacterium]|nr:metal-dependent hydrolase [Alphaproteobacteria bacterium]